MLNFTNILSFIIKYSFYFIFLFISTGALVFKKNNSILFGSSIVLLTVLAIFRYNIGTDYFSYYFIYEWVDKTNLNSIISSLPGIEYGFLLLIGFSKNLGFSYQVFIALLSTLMIGLIAHYVKQNKLNWLMSILVYYSIFFLVWNLSGLRQGLALTLSFYLLYNPKYNFNIWKKVLIILLLMNIHYSSAILLLFILLENINWNQRSLIIYFITCLIFSLIPIQGLFSLLNNITFLGQVHMYQKAMFYINGMAPTYGFFDIPSLMRIFFGLLVLIHYPKLVISFSSWRKAINILVIGLGLFFILSFNDLLASRLSIYALILLVPILPMIVNLYENKRSLYPFVLLSFILLNFFFVSKDLLAMKQQLGINDGKLFAEYHHIFEIKN